MTDATTDNASTFSDALPGARPAVGGGSVADGGGPSAPGGEIAELQKQLAAAQAELERYRQAEAEAAQAKLSTEERLKAELEAARRREFEALAFRAAVEAGFARPQLAAALVARETPPERIAEAVKKLLREYPELAGVTVTPPNAARSESQPATFTRAQIADRKFYLAHREAIEQAAREGRITA